MSHKGQGEDGDHEDDGREASQVRDAEGEEDAWPPSPAWGPQRNKHQGQRQQIGLLREADIHLIQRIMTA